MWITITLIITALVFLLRGPRIISWHKFSRYLLGMFCLWAALVLNRPEDLPSRGVEIFGYVLAVLAAAVIAWDILLEVFYRIKDAIFAGDRFTKVLPDYLSEICAAMETMASRKIGALVVIQKNDSLEGHISGGMPYFAEINAQVLPTLFALTSPVHDGAVIVSEGRIVRVKTVLPIKTSAPISLGVGTRHRAAVGITEKTDAIVIVASEERGEISIAYRGQLVKPSSPEEFRALLLAALKGKNIGLLQQELMRAMES